MIRVASIITAFAIVLVGLLALGLVLPLHREIVWFAIMCESFLLLLILGRDEKFQNDK